jgi:hypothetical protein
VQIQGHNFFWFSIEVAPANSQLDSYKQIINFNLFHKNHQARADKKCALSHKSSPKNTCYATFVTSIIPKSMFS